MAGQVAKGLQEPAGQEYLSLNADNGSVHVDTTKVEPEDLEHPRKAYEFSIKRRQSR
ncbi:hypothetical protein AB0C81_15095 [Streptomyces roseoverticillatus]|uniref:hypothetical protein n=1 Tax=Streptomyces roseoverticillatus TaxID=66429 RepID=UPI0033D84CA2